MLFFLGTKQRLAKGDLHTNDILKDLEIKELSYSNHGDSAWSSYWQSQMEVPWSHLKHLPSIFMHTRANYACTIPVTKWNPGKLGTPPLTPVPWSAGEIHPTFTPVHVKNHRQLALSEIHFILNLLLFSNILSLRILQIFPEFLQLSFMYSYSYGLRASVIVPMLPTYTSWENSKKSKHYKSYDNDDDYDGPTESRWSDMLSWAFSSSE